MADHFTRTLTPNNTPAAPVDVAQTLTTLATLLLATPEEPLGPLTVTRAGRRPVAAR
ncbi:hypothetical protein OG245_15260 [Streptomyces sp. NBC_01116]|uniref:hypothetical protein n=1 Tax=Streptomyces sp. NBC_01116 TaxID=2903752 RepID=UPI00325627BF